MPEAQWAQDGPQRAGDTRHNYVVFNQTHARELMMNDPSNANAWLTITDTSHPAADVFTPERIELDAQRLDARNDSDYSGLVLAHQVKITTTNTVPDDYPATGERVVQQVESLVGIGTTGTGAALRLTGIQVAKANDTMAGFLDGNHLSAGATIVADVYRLSGNKTYDSECVDVPLYDYVKPYFRCGGYEHALLGFGLGGSAGSACYDQALQFFDYAIAEISSNVTREGEGLSDNRTPNGVLIGSILYPNQEDPANASTIENATAYNLAMATSWATTYQNRTLDLIECISYSAGAGTQSIGLGITSQGFNQLLRSALDGSALGLQEESALQVQNLFVQTYPSLAANGEPTRLVTTSLISPWELTKSPFVALAGPTQVEYVVDEWSTRAQNVTLNLTTRDLVGQEISQETLAWYPNASTVIQLPNMPEALQKPASVWTGEAAYIFGGANSQGWRDEILRYDPATRTYATMNARLPVAMKFPVAVWTGEYAYILGVGNVIRYDPAHDATLVMNASFPNTVERASAIWTGEAAYLFGGAYSAAIYRYDPSTDIITNTGKLLPSSLKVGNSLVWTGTQVYVFGSYDIATYTPATNTISLKAEKLPNYATYGTTLWDGKRAYVIAYNTVVRYDPTTATFQDMPYEFSTSGTKMTAAGSSGLLFGGPNGEAYAYLPGQRIIVGYASNIATVNLQHARSYEMVLAATDTYGNVLTDAHSFTVDVGLPTAITTLPSLSWVNKATRVEWLIQDDVSGLASANIETWNFVTSAWESSGTTLDPGLVGATSPTTFGLTLSLPHDAVARLRVVVTDRAGNNLVTAPVELRFDLLAPNVPGFIDNLNAQGYLTQPWLTSWVSAYENSSGLTSLRFYLKNMSGEYDLEPTMVFENASFSGTYAKAIKAWPNVTYQLRVLATDRAGNVNQSNLTMTNFQYSPTLESLAPGYLFQETTTSFPVVADVTLPDYPELVPDYTLLRVRDPSGNVVLEDNRTSQGGRL
ncbi:MAG: Ig-like domain repeat protein, partial [Ilumatobacteraceae bacterium]